MMPSRDSLPTLLHLSGLSDFDRERTTFWAASPRQPSLRHVSKSLHQSISHSHSPAHPPLTAAGSGTLCIWRPERVRWVACFCPGVWSQRGSLLPLPSVRAGMTLASSPLFGAMQTPLSPPTFVSLPSHSPQRGNESCLHPLRHLSAQEHCLSPSLHVPLSAGTTCLSAPVRHRSARERHPPPSAQPGSSFSLRSAVRRSSARQRHLPAPPPYAPLSPGTTFVPAPVRRLSPGAARASSHTPQRGNDTRLRSSQAPIRPPTAPAFAPLLAAQPGCGISLRSSQAPLSPPETFFSIPSRAPQPRNGTRLRPPTLHPARKRYFSLLQPDAPQPIRDIFIHLLTRPSAQERHPSTPPLHPPTAVGDDPSHLPTQCRPAPPPPSLQAQRGWSSSPYFSPVGFFLASHFEHSAFVNKFLTVTSQISASAGKTLPSSEILPPAPVRAQQCPSSSIRYQHAAEIWAQLCLLSLVCSSTEMQ